MRSNGPASTNLICIARVTGFDPLRDLAPISLMVSVPQHGGGAGGIAHSERESPGGSRARANPGQLTYGSVSVGSSGQLAAALLGAMAQVRMTNVPYSGGVPAQVDLISGRLSMMFDNAFASLPHIREGRLRAIAITSARRSPVLPELPTVAELGYPGYENSVWMGALAAARTPPAILDRLNAGIVATLDDPAMRVRLQGLVFDVTP